MHRRALCVCVCVWVRVCVCVCVCVCVHSVELEAIQAGAERTRRRALVNTPVVGTTCAALLQVCTHTHTHYCLLILTHTCTT